MTPELIFLFCCCGLVIAGTVQLAISMSVGGTEFRSTVSREVDHPNPYGPITLPAGKVVTSWVKTDADTAACDLPAGHGYSNGNFDVYWEVGGVEGRRYGVPGTISTNALTLDGGSGDDFPASATEDIVVTRQVQINTAIDGDAISVIGVLLSTTNKSLATRGHATFDDAAGDDIANIDLVANVGQAWDVAGGASNPFTGDPITVCYASNGNSDVDATITIISGEDSTP